MTSEKQITIRFLNGGCLWLNPGDPPQGEWRGRKKTLSVEINKVEQTSTTLTVSFVDGRSLHVVYDPWPHGVWMAPGWETPMTALITEVEITP